MWLWYNDLQLRPQSPRVFSFHPCFQVTYLLARSLTTIALFLLFGKTSCDEKFIAMLLGGISGWCCFDGLCRSGFKKYCSWGIGGEGMRTLWMGGGAWALMVLWAYWYELSLVGCPGSPCILLVACCIKREEWEEAQYVKSAIWAGQSCSQVA